MRLLLTLIFLVITLPIVSAQDIDGKLDEHLTNSIEMKLVCIKSGKFTMGSPENEAGRARDEAQEEVMLAADFYLGVHEVTQAQYLRVMGENPSFFQSDLIDSSTHPVEQVSWADATEFCRKLSELPIEKSMKRHYRLPKESEWEYACRAGSAESFSFGADLTELGNYGWYLRNSEQKTHPVGKKKPNSWGLFDMHGNVMEMCESERALSPELDVLNLQRKTKVLLRGGDYFDEPSMCRSANRLEGIPIDFRGRTAGFRVVMEIMEDP